MWPILTLIDLTSNCTPFHGVVLWRVHISQAGWWRALSGASFRTSFDIPTSGFPMLLKKARANRSLVTVKPCEHISHPPFSFYPATSPLVTIYFVKPFKLAAQRLLCIPVRVHDISKGEPTAMSTMKWGSSSGWTSSTHLPTSVVLPFYATINACNKLSYYLCKHVLRSDSWNSSRSWVTQLSFPRSFTHEIS